MYQAAIVEDEAGVREMLATLLKKQFDQKETLVAFSCFANGKSFLSCFHEGYHYDMVFLDIEMPMTDGISVAKDIRKVNENIPIVFISGRETLVFDTFAVQPFRFIRKSHLDASLAELVESLVIRLRSDEEKRVFVSEPGTKDLYSFDLARLLYIEAQRKDCRFVNDGGEVVIRCTFGYAESIFSQHGFLKPHRSYLVNPSAVFCIGRNDMKLSNGANIPVSRDRLQETKKCFLKYTMEREGL